MCHPHLSGFAPLVPGIARQQRPGALNYISLDFNQPLTIQLGLINALNEYWGQGGNSAYEMGYIIPSEVSLSGMEFAPNYWALSIVSWISLNPHFTPGQSVDLYAPDSTHFRASSGVSQKTGLRFRGCDGSAEYEWNALVARTGDFRADWPPFTRRPTRLIMDTQAIFTHTILIPLFTNELEIWTPGTN